MEPYSCTPARPGPRAVGAEAAVGPKSWEFNSPWGGREQPVLARGGRAGGGTRRLRHRPRSAGRAIPSSRGVARACCPQTAPPTHTHRGAGRLTEPWSCPGGFAGAPSPSPWWSPPARTPAAAAARSRSRRRSWWPRAAPPAPSTRGSQRAARWSGIPQGRTTPCWSRSGTTWTAGRSCPAGTRTRRKSAGTVGAATAISTSAATGT